MAAITATMPASSLSYMGQMLHQAVNGLSQSSTTGKVCIQPAEGFLGTTTPHRAVHPIAGHARVRSVPNPVQTTVASPTATHTRSRSFTAPNKTECVGVSGMKSSAIRSMSGSGDPETFLLSPRKQALQMPSHFQSEAFPMLDLKLGQDAKDVAQTVSTLKEQLAKKRANQMLMTSYVTALVQRTHMRQSSDPRGNAQPQKARVVANAKLFTSKYADALDTIQPHLTIQKPTRRRTLDCGDLSAWHLAGPPSSAAESAAYSAFCLNAK